MAPIAPSTTVRPLTTPAPKKKRIRRQQVELKYLRELAWQLEGRLEQLKKRRVIGRPRPVETCSLVDSNGQVHFDSTSVWEGIADRQFKERSRAERQNLELKTLLQAQHNVAHTLQERIQRAVFEEQTAVLQLKTEGTRLTNSKEEGDDEDAGIFADLLAQLVRIRLEVQRYHFEDPRSLLVLATWGISIGEPRVRVDSDAGLVLERQGCSLLPFSAQIAAAACWRMFAITPLGKKASNEEMHMEDDLVARSFTCSSTHLGQTVTVRGKHTCRRYVDENGCITIVFAGRSSPANIKDTPCQDVQIQKSGWIKVHPVQSGGLDQHSIAIVEMHSEMMLCFQDNCKDQHRAHELFDWVNKSFQMVNTWYTQTLSEILIDEDWKAFHKGKSANLAIGCI